MPLYEFVCLSCETTFDARRDVDAAEPACPSCGQERVRRRFSLFASPAGPSREGSGSGGCACGGACACGH